MTCLSCEERGRLLKQARDAYYDGDLAEVERLLTQVFGTIRMDIRKLGATLYDVGAPLSLFGFMNSAKPPTLKDIADADPNDSRPEHEKKDDHSKVLLRFDKPHKDPVP